ncbi:MAG: glycosyltransferase, partial [Cyclobacteriaceae bacterium]
FGPPIFEWIIAKVLRKKIIYDFDDAIWMADGTEESTLWRWIKWRSKVASICSWSWKVSAGNEYLAEFAKQYCDQVEILPTVVDTEIHKDQKPTANGQRPTAKETLRQAQSDRQQAQSDLTIESQKPKAKSQKPAANGQQPTANSQQPVIGWTGSHSTLFYLDMLVPILQELEKDHDFEFLVIANKDPQLPIKNFRFVAWNKETEIEDLSKIDIGVMPLEDNEWSKGKCGFKLIQYLSLGIPAIASPVGVNTEIVMHNQTGLIATTPNQWLEALKQLLEQETLRKQMGDSGRKLIQKKYSVASQQEKFLQLFQ